MNSAGILFALDGRDGSKLWVHDQATSLKQAALVDATGDGHTELVVATTSKIMAFDTRLNVPLGERLTRFYEHAGTRFVLVFEPFERKGEPKVAAIYSSPLERARETALPIARARRLPSGVSSSRVHPVECSSSSPPPGLGLGETKSFLNSTPQAGHSSTSRAPVAAQWPHLGHSRYFRFTSLRDCDPPATTTRR